MRVIPQSIKSAARGIVKVIGVTARLSNHETCCSYRLGHTLESILHEVHRESFDHWLNK